MPSLALQFIPATSESSSQKAGQRTCLLTLVLNVVMSFLSILLMPAHVRRAHYAPRACNPCTSHTPSPKLPLPRTSKLQPMQQSDLALSYRTPSRSSSPTHHMFRDRTPLFSSPPIHTCCHSAPPTCPHHMALSPSHTCCTETPLTPIHRHSPSPPPSYPHQHPPWMMPPLLHALLPLPSSPHLHSVTQGSE